MVDQVRDNLGVGLRFERVPGRAQALALLLVVFDDAVVHHRKLAEADVRVGVGLGDAAVRGPAGVANPEVGVETLCLRRGLHFGDPAGAAHAADLASAAFAIEHRDAGRIVATVFQPLQALDQNGDHIAIRDRADDSAHGGKAPAGVRVV